VDDPDEAQENLMDVIKRVQDESFPIKTTKICRYEEKENCYMTTGLLKHVRQKIKCSETFVRTK
jgi:hypothetical protein